jgi:peptide subunit release factor 1 (eRF1)
MLDKNIVSPLSELPSPVLTVYLNTQPADPSVHALTQRNSLWLKEEAKRVLGAIHPREWRTFQEQVERIDRFTIERVPEEQALLILAGDSTWRVVRLPIAAENEMHWGRPALSQLEMMLDENKPHCVAVIDRKGARCFRYWLGEMRQLAQRRFEIDSAKWKKKDMGIVAGQDVKKTRGSQRDVFAHRVDAQYRRFCRETANDVARLCRSERLDMIFVVGSKRLTQPLEASLAKSVRGRVVSIEADLGQLPLSKLQERLKSKIAASQENRQLALVKKLANDGRHSVLGIDETLAQLQKGKLRTLVLPHHLNGTLHECIECGWMNRSADPVCPACGRELRSADLRDALFASARQANTDISVVAGGAESKLTELGGIGGWLRGRTQAELR